MTPQHLWTTPLFRAVTFTGLVLVYGAGTWLPTLMADAGYDLSSSPEFSITFNIGAIAGTVIASTIADRGFLKAATVTSFVLAASP
uniref:MFS transporter n=1 Tax=Streptomyces sp. NBC_00008 TaxID=2903610 RepID=A0AAU2W194_9ACTN